MSQFTIDELQASLISHAYRISKSNTSLEGAFATQSSRTHGGGRGRFNSRGIGNVFLEEDIAAVLQVSRVDENFRTPVIQVVTSLINKKYNVIIVRNFKNFHMNAGSICMTKESEVKIGGETLALRQDHCF